MLEETTFMQLVFFYTGTLKEKIEAANKLLIAEFESERAHHQKLVREKERLQQRLENLHGEMQVLTSPQNAHKRTPSDISAISLESFTSSVSPDEKKEDAEEDADKEVCFILFYSVHSYVNVRLRPST